MNSTLIALEPLTPRAYGVSLLGAWGSAGMRVCGDDHAGIGAGVCSVHADGEPFQSASANEFSATSSKLTVKPAARGVPPRGRPV